MDNVKLIYFNANWSASCKALNRQLNGMDFGLPMDTVNIDSNRALAEKYRVKTIPCVMLIEDDKEVDRAQGTIAPWLIKEMVSKMRERKYYSSSRD